MDGLIILAAVLKQCTERPAVQCCNTLQEIAEVVYVPG